MIASALDVPDGAAQSEHPCVSSFGAAARRGQTKNVSTLVILMLPVGAASAFGPRATAPARAARSGQTEQRPAVYKFVVHAEAQYVAGAEKCFGSA